MSYYPPCGGGGTLPELPWVPDLYEELEPQAPLPVNEQNNNDPKPYKKNAQFGGTRNYITPSGVVITLPENAQVNFYKNIDTRVYPNGALYSFEMPNGDRYISIQREYLQPGAIVVPPPVFQQYYLIEKNTNKVNFNKPFPAAQFSYPALENGKTKAVRMRVEKRPDGKCEMIREVVDYSPSTYTPTSASHSTNMNYEVESLDKDASIIV